MPLRFGEVCFCDFRPRSMLQHAARSEGFAPPLHRHEPAVPCRAPCCRCCCVSMACLRVEGVVGFPLLLRAARIK